MKKKLGKRKRKQLLSKIPANLAFWSWTIHKEEEMNQFLLRGDERQRQHIVRVLNYLKRFEPMEFSVVNGMSWLKKFKESLNEDCSF